MIKLYHTEEIIKNFSIETIILSRGPKFQWSIHRALCVFDHQIHFEMRLNTFVGCIEKFDLKKSWFYLESETSQDICIM